MWLKAKYSWAGDSRGVNFKDGWEHITIQPATTVVGLELLLWDVCSLEEACQFRDLPLCHQGGTVSWRGWVGHCHAFCSRIIPSVVVEWRIGGKKVDAGVSGHGGQGENNAAEKQEMMGRQEWETMRWDVFIGVSFIGTAGDMVTIRFPEKSCLSISTTHVIWARDRGAKRLEV
jgi:hypothetical protein